MVDKKVLKIVPSQFISLQENEKIAYIQGFLNGYANCCTDAVNGGGFIFYFFKINFVENIKKSLEVYFSQKQRLAKLSNNFSLIEIDEKDWIKLLRERCERWFYGDEIKKSKEGFIFRCEIDGIDYFIGMLNELFSDIKINLFEAKGIYWDDVVRHDYIIESEIGLFLLHFAYDGQ